MTQSASAYDELMRLALLRAQGAGRHGDVPIGAVVVDASGEVVGAGSNRREVDHDPIAHAEIVAMKDAAARLGSWRLDDCTLVVTLEPCTMCAGAVVQARVGRLVFGAWNDEMGAVGTLWDVVRDRRLHHRPEVVSGVLADECGALLQTYFVEHRDSGGTGPIG